MLPHQCETSSAPTVAQQVEAIILPNSEIPAALTVLGGLNINIQQPNRLTPEQISQLDNHFNKHLGGNLDETTEAVALALIDMPLYALGPAVRNLDLVHRPENDNREHVPDALETVIGQIIGRRNFVTNNDVLVELNRLYKSSNRDENNLRGLVNDLDTFGQAAALVDPGVRTDRRAHLKHQRLLAVTGEFAAQLSEDEVVERRLRGVEVTLGEVRTKIATVMKPGLLRAAEVYVPNTLSLNKAAAEGRDGGNIVDDSLNDFPYGYLSSDVYLAKKLAIRRFELKSGRQDMLAQVVAYHALGLIGLAREYHRARTEQPE